MGESLEFDTWLKKTLIKLNTDDEIFSSYIKGILEADDSHEEKKEALEGIISGITDCDIDQLCAEIVSRWCSCSPGGPVKEEKEAATATDSLDNKLAQLMVQQASTAPLAAQRRTTTEQAALKKTILAQYADVSGEEDECDSEEEGPKGASGGLMAKNTNAACVEQELRQKREQNKEEHKQKKAKDKEEREKQKAKADERKEKEKKRTQKGERRR